jgi:hypothetical protein
LAQLAELIKGGDPKRIDPGPETVDFAKRFAPDGGIFPFGPYPIYYEDIVAYQMQLLKKRSEEPPPVGLRTLELRQKAKENFGIDKLDHPLVHLMEGMDPSYAKDFRGLPAFIKLAPVWKQQIQGRRLSALYPGSGSHIAPLAAAMDLIQSGSIDRADFTFTEIEDYSNDLMKLLTKGLELGIFDEISLGNWKHFSSGAPNVKDDAGAERMFRMVYQGKEIAIRYALKRSGEAYYRKEYFQDANLVIFHDIDPWSNSFNILAEMLFDRKTKGLAHKKQLLIMEGSPVDSYYIAHFPKELQQTELESPYGHCMKNGPYPESGECQTQTARVFSLHDPALKQLAERYSDPSSLSFALYLYSGPMISR